MKLVLKGSGGTGRGYELWLDGIKQERVRGVVLGVEVDRINTATVTYLIDGAEVEVELPASEECREFGCGEETAG